MAVAFAGGLGYVLVYPQCRALYHGWQGETALTAQDFRQARQHFRRCLEAWPDSAGTHFNLARACRGDGDLAEARRHLDRARDLGWPGEAIDLERLLLRAQSGEVDAVAPPLQQALGAGHPESALILEALVLGFLEGNRLHEARLFALLLSSRFPDRWRSHLLLGQVHELFLRPELASAEYRRVLELKPDQAETRLWLAQYLLATRSAAEALGHFQGYQKARPEDPVGQVGVAACQHELGQLQAALQTLEPLTERLGENAQALALRGRIELDLNGARDALPWFERAEAHGPQNLDVLSGLAAAWRQLGNADKAQTCEGRKRRLQEERAQAEELTRQIAKLDEDAAPADRDRRVQLRSQLGAMLLRLGEDQKGLAWLVGALREDPGHRPTHLALAEHYQRAGNPAQAQAHRRIAQAGKEE